MNIQQQKYYDAISAIVTKKGGKVISDRYTKMINKMIFECENGHQWETEARSSLKKMWCRFCWGNTREQGEAAFRKRVEEKGGKILGQYSGANNQVLVECHCGCVWKTIPLNIASGKWCPKCKSEKSKDPRRFYDTVKLRYGKVLGVYLDTHTRIEVQCEKKHNWFVKPNSITNGTWCPICVGSTGEQAISSYLSRKGIPFKTQSPIKGLPRKRYDFVVEYKGKNIVIEYDGQMHFKWVKYYHKSEEEFKYRQSVDRIKTYNAINNGYQVIRIDYTQVLRINEHLDFALESNCKYQVSTPSLYETWLSGEITVDEYQSVYNGRKASASIKQ